MLQLPGIAKVTPLKEQLFPRNHFKSSINVSGLYSLLLSEEASPSSSIESSLVYGPVQ
jgi:hypothetical protein